jgi:hypothetical protein
MGIRATRRIVAYSFSWSAHGENLPLVQYLLAAVQTPLCDQHMAGSN